MNLKSNSTSSKYVKLTGPQKTAVIQRLVSKTNLSKKRAIKAVNRYNNAVDFANAHSRELASVLKGNANLVYKYITPNLKIQKLVVVICIIQLESQAKVSEKSMLIIN